MGTHVISLVTGVNLPMVLSALTNRHRMTLEQLARKVSEDAKKRLEVIQRFVELGSGFNIASHDLEIRGGGELLGPQQSGHIAAIGYELAANIPLA